MYYMRMYMFLSHLLLVDVSVTHISSNSVLHSPFLSSALTLTSLYIFYFPQHAATLCNVRRFRASLVFCSSVYSRRVSAPFSANQRLMLRLRRQRRHGAAVASGSRDQQTLRRH